MVKLNGNIPNINLGFSIGLMSLMLFTVVVGGLYIQDVHKQSEENGKHIDRIEATLADFIRDRNIAFNYTYTKLENISTYNNDILQQQLTNEKNIIGNITQEFANLTAHRVIANLTYDQMHKEHQSIMKGLNITDDTTNETNNTIVNKILEYLNKTHSLGQDTVPDTQLSNKTIEGPTNGPTGFR